jgi:hypothetical protein
MRLVNTRIKKITKNFAEAENRQQKHSKGKARAASDHAELFGVLLVAPLLAQLKTRASSAIWRIATRRTLVAMRRSGAQSSVSRRAET